MRKLFKIRPRGSRTGVLLLALLLFRSYVPAGFMPADGVPFALQLCPAALVGMPDHLHHHAGTHAQFELCPFGSVPGAGPLSHHIEFASVGPAPSQPIVAFEAPAITQRAERSHPPRGPPSLA